MADGTVQQTTRRSVDDGVTWNAVKAFDIHAVDYLLKPFRRERFREAVPRNRVSSWASVARVTCVARPQWMQVSCGSIVR